MPSCKIVSNFYDTFVGSACEDYLYNFNAYWFSFLLSLLILVIMIGVSISQAYYFNRLDNNRNKINKGNATETTELRQITTANHIYPTLPNQNEFAQSTNRVQPIYDQF
jgi:hypothetical protein